MRSPGDAGAGGRVLLERVARAVVLAALAWLVILAFRDRAAPEYAVVRSRGLPRALIAWSSSGAPAGVHLLAERSLDPFARDWLRALAGAGTGVTWEGAAAAPTAVAAERVADPEGGTSAWIAAPAGVGVIVEDAAGRLDSIVPGAPGARILARSGPEEILARTGSTVARSLLGDSLVLGRLLLLGRAAWESKFVAAALEERGWKIDARLRLSPRGDVRQGVATPIDTMRYSAVVVLDSIGTAEALQLAGFVRSGGGVILSGPAVQSPGLAMLAAGSPGLPEPAHEPFDSGAREPRGGLELIPVAPRADAVVLERRGNRAAVAARRIERGRAVTSGYIDTWRWRMGGGDAALREHRDWWAGLIAGVAYTGRIVRPPQGVSDEAPLATLMTRLGPASGAPSRTDGTPRISSRVLFALLMAALLLEWASRRLRGAP
jgi:hypothetical protein